MKTKIILSAIILAVVSALVLNISDNASASSNLGKEGCVYTIYLTGTGYTDNNASVRLREISTGMDSYASFSSTGVYTIDCPSPGLYNVFVCTNHPSYGANYNVTIGKAPGSTTVSLTGGNCPYGGD